MKTFQEYHQENPDIYQAFKKITFQLIDNGRTYYGAKGIIEVIRYDRIIGAVSYATEDQDSLEFKINNNYAPDYARKFMVDYPLYNNFFKLRQLKKARN